MPISKVKSVTPSGTYNSKFGLFYKYEYEFEDTEQMNANHKTQSPFAVGTEVEYEIKGSNDYGQWGSVKKHEPQQSYGKQSKSFDDPKRQMLILSQSTMQKAVDILLSGVVAIEVTSVNDFIKKAEDVADIMMSKQIELAKKHVKEYENE